jgi:nucleotide-binding universal stress UspA family protein
MSETNDGAVGEKELIVVGVDGSEPSKRALRWAARQAALTSADLAAVIAWEPPDVFGWMTPPIGVAVDFSANARHLLEATLKSAFGSEPPVPVQIEVKAGRPALVLDRASERADLLVVGNRGRGAIEEVLLGSVSLHCVFHAACPVVVVRGRQPSSASTPSRPDDLPG